MFVFFFNSFPFNCFKLQTPSTSKSPVSFMACFGLTNERCWERDLVLVLVGFHDGLRFFIVVFFGVCFPGHVLSLKGDVHTILDRISDSFSF